MTREEKIASGAWRSEVESEARSWLFTPYMHKGRRKGVGVDCGGLLYEVYNPWFGPFAAFPDNYAPDWALHQRDELYLDFIMPYVIEVAVPAPGGFSVFHYGRNYSHAAIYTSSGTYIHAYGTNKSGSVRESRPSFFRHKGGLPRAVKHFDARGAWR